MSGVASGSPETGQFAPESVVNLLRNGWSIWGGISGQFRAEWAVNLVRDTQ